MEHGCHRAVSHYRMNPQHCEWLTVSNNRYMMGSSMVGATPSCNTAPKHPVHDANPGSGCIAADICLFSRRRSAVLVHLIQDEQVHKNTREHRLVLLRHVHLAGTLGICG